MADDFTRARRKSTRKYLATQCRVAFEYKGSEYRAVLQNISDTGAGFRLEITFKEPKLAVGDRVIFDVHSDYGESQITGRIIWTNSVGALYTWGVQFVDLSEDAKRLVANLLESTF
jgi:c-di-GMP-binding flagellar brake protein YcgR